MAGGHKVPVQFRIPRQKVSLTYSRLKFENIITLMKISLVNLIISIIVFATIFGVYTYAIKQNTTSNNLESSNSKIFTADNQGGNLTFRYPPDFVVTENSDGFITFKNEVGKTVADLTATPGSVEDNVNFITKTSNHWFKTVPTKTQLKTESDLDCTKLTGTLDTHVGSFNSHPTNDHVDQIGTVYVCENPLLVFNWYENEEESNNLSLILNSL